MIWRRQTSMSIARARWRRRSESEVKLVCLRETGEATRLAGSGGRGVGGGAVGGGDDGDGDDENDFGTSELFIQESKRGQSEKKEKHTKLMKIKESAAAYAFLALKALRD